MIRSLKAMEGYTLEALDGDIGRAADFLFDDARWAVRYLVADTGRWLPGRKVLISPAFLEAPSWDYRRFPVRLTREQIENAPPLDSDAPISRRYERTYHEFFATPYYWMGNGLWGNYPFPGMIVPPEEPGPPPGPPPGELQQAEPDATHVRSVREVVGYGVTGADGDSAGHVEDFLAEDSDWSLRYLVVDRSLLPFSRKVILPVEWISSVDWVARNLRVDEPESRIAQAPEYDPREPVNEATETVLYDYYGRPRGRADQRL